MQMGVLHLGRAASTLTHRPAMLLGHLQDSASISQRQETCALQNMVQTRNQNNFDPAKCSGSIAPAYVCVSPWLCCSLLCAPNLHRPWPCYMAFRRGHSSGVFLYCVYMPSCTLVAADVCSPGNTLCSSGTCPLADAGSLCNVGGTSHLHAACLTHSYATYMYAYIVRAAASMWVPRP